MKLTTLRSLYLQSHHTGIEIWLEPIIRLEKWHLQSHHTGIEIPKPAAQAAASETYNRTILELKCQLAGCRCASLFLQSHHTGIEMSKHHRCIDALVYLQSHHTGIEITDVGGVLATAGTYNRTILELKFLINNREPFRRHAYNRTILELKSFTEPQLNGLCSYNRTILELK